MKPLILSIRALPFGAVNLVLFKVLFFSQFLNFKFYLLIKLITPDMEGYTHNK